VVAAKVTFAIPGDLATPTGGYGYATPSGIVLTSTNGRVRTLPLPPRRTRAGAWIGFSPDGRYLGLGDFSSKLGVLDLSTGKLHILYQERSGKTASRNALYRKWWRAKSGIAKTPRDQG